MDTDKLKQDIVFETTLRGRRCVFHSTWGLFCPRNIDKGSEMLAAAVELGQADVTLDLGCGYGAIGVPLAMASPAGRVHMVDKDYVAVAYARKNVQANGLTNCQVYLSNAFSEVPADVLLDNVVANLPAKVGKELLTIILCDARRYLRPGGRLWVVTITGLRKFIQRNFLEVFGNYDKVKQGQHYTAAVATKER